ncbi:hypothetical protein C8Q73DRAFT_269139 [Cubamyces lactineus]|nr:hypothetical protein C8Q73DRAFT_269139 [Cubamyces lactineus]
MAAFLSKVFPRKKEKETNKRSSVSSLLEGKFEAVSPTVSPSAAKFEETSQNPKERGRDKQKEKEKDGGFSLFRSKSRPLSPVPDTRKTVSDTPHLTLNLPVPKEERSRALGVVFEADPENRSALPDNVIGERRLNPLEALVLVKACSSAIVANGGLETLGVMHPFWHSASPEVQRKLISLFILSLASKSPITTLSPSPTSALSTFDSELEYTRSPHDIAAVLRWALRHLRLEGESFGRPDGQWKWYQTFAEAERSSSYPLNAFSESLVPQLPPSHLQLLIATLDIVSSLAAHSEHNGISGSKLSKFFGLWLLTTKRSEQGDDWVSFYSRWERAGRTLEHLFLAHIRDEMARKQMPLRLSELVRGYPFHSRSPSADTAVSTTDADLLPRPRLSTRQYDALYVRIDSQLADPKTTKQKQHALRLISDALKSDLELANADPKYRDLWEAIRKAALASDEPVPILTHVDGYPSVSRIFSDETIRLLSLIPAESTGSVTTSVPTIRAPRPPRKRSSSLNASARANGNGNSNGKAPTNGSAAERPVLPSSPTSPTSPTSPKDWIDFSASGFGDSALGKDFANTLLDKDVEVTTPPPVVERKTSKKRKASSGHSRRSSVDSPDPESANRAAQLSANAPPPPPKSKSTVVSLVKLDEAFIDFWSDALLDPISADWPNFVVAQLKSLPGVELDGKPISWLVLEQRFVTPPPPPPPAEPEATTPPAPRRASSPRPSMRSELSARKSSTLAAAKKRLTFFSSSQTLGGLSSKTESKAPARKKAKPTRIGEMGEILPEESQEVAKQDKKEPEKPAEQKAAETTAKVEAAPSTEAPKATQPVAGEPKDAAPAPAAVSVPAPVSVTATTDVPAPASPATDVMSPLTPTADDFPAVPVVSGLVASAAIAATAAAVEPLKVEDAETGDKPVLPAPEAPAVPADPTPADTPSEVPVPEEKTLPPAPEPVVLTGETPGPDVALSTSEPAALAELSTKIDEVVAQAASSPEVNVPAGQVGEQTTEVVPDKVIVEEVVPFETQAEAEAAVEAAAQDERPATVAVEADVPAVAAAPETSEPAPAAAPESEPEPVVESEPVVEAPVEETAPAARVEELKPEASVEETAPEVSVKEPVVEATPAEPEPVLEESAAAPAETIVQESAEIPAEAVAAEPEEPAPVETAPEPEAAPEPETVREEEVPAAVEEEASVPAPVVEEVKDEEDAVVEDVVAPAAEEVSVEPTADEIPAPEVVEEVAASEDVEEPAVAAGSTEVPKSEETPAPEESAVVEVTPPSESHAEAEPEHEVVAEVVETHADEDAQTVDSPTAVPAEAPQAGEPEAEVTEKDEKTVEPPVHETEAADAATADAEKPAAVEASSD